METTPNLAKKMCKVMGELGWVPKQGKNTHFGYNYATEADVVALLRKPLAAAGVMVFASLDGAVEREVVPAANGSTICTSIVMAFTFVDSETGQAHTIRVPGESQDKGDKGVYKAMTGATKYALLKTFLLPTGDDPEEDNEAEKEPPPAEARKTKKAGGPSAAEIAILRKVAKEKGLGQAQSLALLAHYKNEDGQPCTQPSSLNREQFDELLASVKALPTPSLPPADPSLPEGLLADGLTDEQIKLARYAKAKLNLDAKKFDAWLFGKKVKGGIKAVTAAQVETLEDAINYAAENKDA